MQTKNNPISKAEPKSRNTLKAMAAGSVAGIVTSNITNQVIASKNAIPETNLNPTESSNGIVDAIIVNTFDEGTLNATFLDQNYDGFADAIFLDQNDDGTVDAILVDNNYDGIAEAIIVDTNFDGMADNIALDSNSNGVIDAIVIDNNYDNVADAIIMDNDDINNFLSNGDFSNDESRFDLGGILDF